MTTNKFAGTCKDCGEYVAVGKGEISKEFDNYQDEVVWVVRHTDKSICAAVKTEQVKEQSKSNAVSTGINYIKSHGMRSKNVVDGDQVIHDGRKGYNQVGWLLTRTGNTLYLTSRNNLDGMDMSETYIYNSNNGSNVEDLLWTMELI